MILLPYLAITQVAAVAALLTRRERLLSLSIGLVGLIAATGAALLIAPGATELGGEPLVVGAYVRLFLILGTGSAVLLAVVGYATSWQRNVPAAMLASFGWSALALSLPDTGSAVLAATVAGLAGVLVTLVPPARDRGVRVSARELRAVVVAGALAIAGVAWVDVETAIGLDRPTDPIVGFALLGIAVAVGLRFGSVPFHAWAGRLSQAAPMTALPLLLSWAPASFALVVLAWDSTAVAPFASAAGDPGASFGLERALIVVVALLGLVGGAFAAWIQDDTEHVVGYAVAQDTAFVLLALAAPGDVWGSARTFLLVFGLAKTGLAAWGLALVATYRTNRVASLDGWARRSPLLLATLLAVVLATIGWPGSAAWSARWALATGAADGPLGVVLFVLALGSIACYVRLIRIGLRIPGETVARASVATLGWPRSDAGAVEHPVPAVATRSGRGPVASDRLALAVAGGPNAEGAGAVTARVGAAVSGKIGDAGNRLRPVWRSNRVPAATALAVVLAILALATAGGAFGLATAAREPAPPRPALIAPVPASTPAPTASPAATGAPTPAATPSVGATTAPSTGPTTAPSESAPPTSSPAPSASPTASPSPTAAHRTYRVKSGDNLYGIAQRLGTSVAAILALNPSLQADPTKLVIGQVIVVP